MASHPVAAKIKPSISLDISKEQMKGFTLGDMVEVKIQGKVESMSTGDEFPESTPHLRLTNRKILSLRKTNAEKSLEEMEDELPKAER